MSDLVKFSGGGLPANPDALLKGLQNVSQSIQGSTGGTPFLRLLKSGSFAFGPENLEPEEDSEWAMNPASLMHGWACWGDGELLDERMVPFTSPAPNRAELADYGNSWDQQVAMVLQCLNGEDKDVAVLYKGTSTGLRNAVKQLIAELIQQLQTDPDHCVPVLQLDVGSYQHKKYGEIFYPELTVLRWVAFDGQKAASGAVEDQTDGGTEEADDAEETAEPEAPPAKRRRGRAKAKAAKAETGEPADAAEEEAPPASTNRRRRRRAK